MANTIKFNLSGLYQAMQGIDLKGRGVRKSLADSLGVVCDGTFHAYFNYLADYIDFAKQDAIDELVGFPFPERVVDCMFLGLEPSSLTALWNESGVAFTQSESERLGVFYKLLLHRTLTEAESAFILNEIKERNLEGSFILISSNLLTLWKRVLGGKKSA